MGIGLPIRPLFSVGVGSNFMEEEGMGEEMFDVPKFISLVTTFCKEIAI